MSIKIGYTAISRTTNERVEFFAHNSETANRLGTLTARHWAVNHLDQSLDWVIRTNGKFKHD